MDGTETTSAVGRGRIRAVAAAAAHPIVAVTSGRSTRFSVMLLASRSLMMYLTVQPVSSGGPPAPSTATAMVPYRYRWAAPAPAVDVVQLAEHRLAPLFPPCGQQADRPSQQPHGHVTAHRRAGRDGLGGAPDQCHPNAQQTPPARV